MLDLLKNCSWKNKLWYKWTTWWNPYGDVVVWIGPNPESNTNSDELYRCKGIVRREDSLIFQNTLDCHKCEPEMVERYSHRGTVVNDVYLNGTDIFGHATYYATPRVGRHINLD